jgi:ABC-type glycerol-3-phosphate transport system substrate-binding protein
MKFQTIILIAFGVFLLFALLFFGGVIPTPKRGNDASLDPLGAMTMWGTFDDRGMKALTEAWRLQNPGSKIQYVEIPEEDYDDKLLRAFATGKVPDIFFVSHDLLAKYQNQILTIPLASFSTRTFADFYNRGSSVFISGDQVVSYPVAVDPLVLYYNKDLVENEGIVELPQYWTSDFVETVERLTKIDANGLEVFQAGVAMGESTNIDNFDAILSAMMLQLGHSPVQRSGTGLVNNLSGPSAYSSSPGRLVTSFYTSFSNPVNNVYSWNKSMSEAQDEFIAGDLALYFGFGSELLTIQSRNPNLNFDLHQIPQVESVPGDVTYGRFYGLAVPRISRNVNNAARASGLIANTYLNQVLLSGINLQPVRRDLLAQTPDHLYNSVLYSEALRSRAWPNPDPVEVIPIFSEMIEQIVTGNLSASRALSEAEEQIDFVIESL